MVTSKRLGPCCVSWHCRPVPVQWQPQRCHDHAGGVERYRRRLSCVGQQENDKPGKARKRRRAAASASATQPMTRTSAETKNAALTSGSTDRSDQLCISHVGKDCVCSRREVTWSTSLVRFHGGQRRGRWNCCRRSCGGPVGRCRRAAEHGHIAVVVAVVVDANAIPWSFGVKTTASGVEPGVTSSAGCTGGSLANAASQMISATVPAQ